MRIVRFSPNISAGLGTDPLFGVLNDQDQILVLRGDPLYSGIVPTESKVALRDVRLLAPVIPRSKVVCVGKNYADHAAEMGSEVPKEPVIFLKPNTSVIGPNPRRVRNIFICSADVFCASSKIIKASFNVRPRM
jgi:2-keto-4-pentenoate hydratase/2-oxohepta-3-ene-1,7-dioic acid hydratase in catechol pathway